MNGLHFCPSDGWFGDPMPLYHDGTYHIYYTKLHPQGKLLWGHIATKDFVHYTEYPNPFPYNTPGAPINTGCVYYENNRFHAYYAGKDEEGNAWFSHSDSQDGILFRMPGEVCLNRPQECYRQDDT